jgi:signal peptidase I
MRNPLAPLLGRLPRPLRVFLDWALTIVGAILIVLAIKQWVVNPYKIPTSSMEPTLLCAKPELGCTASWSDRVLANRFIYRFRSPHRGEIVVFDTPKRALKVCSGTDGSDVFVKRLIGLPGERVKEVRGAIFIDGKKLNEPYVLPANRDQRNGNWPVPKGRYFFMGDNRASSCDSRDWGTVPRANLIGPVFMIYWPPKRITFF